MNVDVENLKPRLETAPDSVVANYAPSQRFPGLTIKQANVFAWIIDFVTMYDYSPAMNEIAMAFGIALQTAKDHVRQLKKKGFLLETSGRRIRAMSINPEKSKGPLIKVIQGMVYVAIIPKAMTAETARKIGEKFLEAARICDAEVEAKASYLSASQADPNEE